MHSRRPGTQSRQRRHTHLHQGTAKAAVTNGGPGSPAPRELTYDDTAIARDLLDFVDMMLATGLRIGETAAIQWSSIDLE